MNRILINCLWGAFLFAGCSLPAQAEGGWYLGGGLVSVSFEDDLNRTDRGAGITFSGGYRFDDLLSAEILAGISVHEDALFGDDVVQSSIMGGAKFSLGGEKFRPYGVIGVSLNVVRVGDLDDLEDDDDFDEFDEIDGLGLYVGIGADVFVAKSHAINIGFRSNRWNGEGDGPDLDVRTDMFSIAYNYYL